MLIVTEMKIIDVPISHAEFNRLNMVAAGALTGLNALQISSAWRSPAYGTSPVIFAVENEFTKELDLDLNGILKQSLLTAAQLTEITCQLIKLKVSLGKRIKFLFTGRL